MIFALSLILRSSVVALLLLPIIVPTVSRSRPAQYQRTVTILSNRNYTASQKQALLTDVKRTFGQDANVRVENHASASLHALQVFDSIGQAVQDANDLTVLDLVGGLWGDTAKRFESKLLQTDVARTNRLFSAQRNMTALSENSKPFLFIADLYVPKVSFLGEETIAVVEITGHLPSGQSEDIEILVRSNQELVASVRATAVGRPDNVVHEIIEVPVSFLKAQAQTLNVALRSPLALSPFDRASTTVFVAHNKTTILHVAVAPDWSLRTLRQKLKFWPNLDLLSYYILRERWDEYNAIPQSQLSLIEFPSEKLFGEQLPNFHGIVAQNFFFDHYLEQRDALNLVDYVRSGGRMFLQAGPLSFLSQNPAIQALFPCESPPVLTTAQNAESWRGASNSSITLPEDLRQVLPSIQSTIHFSGCKPKDDTHVLATRADGEPVLLARNLGRGLVVTTLAADWHTHSLQAASNPAGNHTANLLGYNLQVAATEKLTAWIIEFLQRRQDSGLRAPELSGPRLFADDRMLLTRSRGAFRQDAQIIIESSGGRRLLAHPILLPFLEKQGLALEEPLGAIAGNSNSPDDFVPLSLGVRTPGLTEDDEKALMRGGLWPILSRTENSLPENSSFLSSIPPLSSFAPQNKASNQGKSQVKEARPLLEAYPWLMSLALALFALDTLLSILFQRTSGSKLKTPFGPQQ